jgi:hypothetical protein
MYEGLKPYFFVAGQVSYSFEKKNVFDNPQSLLWPLFIKVSSKHFVKLLKMKVKMYQQVKW